MRMKSLILIFIALGCGLVASIGISQVMNRDFGGGSLEMEQILVALQDIDIGSKLDAHNVKLEEWPKAKIPEGAVRKVEDVKDKFANARFFKGEALHVSKISDSLTNIANKVPPGYRAMPVKVDEDTVMKGISPGDKVDVMVILRKNGAEIPDTGVFTILTNVRVFAVNTNTERATDAKGEAQNFKTVSLLVKPDHARELALAANMGKITLTLRRPEEVDEEGGEQVTPMQEILAGKSKQGTEQTAAAQQPAQPQSFKSLIDQGTAEPTLDTEEPAFRMTILTPADRTIYEWNKDPHGLPTSETVVSTSGGNGNSSASPPPAAPRAAGGSSGGSSRAKPEPKSAPHGEENPPGANQ